jgi:rod shape determining protein RodA
MGLGLFLMFVLTQVNPVQLKRWTPAVYLVSVLLLFLVLDVGVARRYFVLGGVSIQPSVLTLLTVPMMTAWLLDRREWSATRKGFAAIAAVILLPTLLIARQPDFGMAALCLGAGWITALLSAVRARLLRFTALALPLVGVVGWTLLSQTEYRRQRILAWLNPENDPFGAGWLATQLSEAISSGGFLGRGWLTATSQVPERHSDFILSLVAEEFGAVGVAVLLACFALVLYRAFVLSSRLREVFGRLLGLGFTGLVGLQIAVNVGVVYGWLPIVGVPLPLISYGGSSIVMLLAGFGILVSICRSRHEAVGSALGDLD